MRAALGLTALVVGAPIVVAGAYTFGPGASDGTALGAGDVIMVGGPLLYLLATLALAFWLGNVARR